MRKYENKTLQTEN